MRPAYQNRAYFQRNGYLYRDNYSCPCKYYWRRKYDCGSIVIVNNATGMRKVSTSSEIVIRKEGRKEIRKSFYSMSIRTIEDFLRKHKVEIG